MENKNAKKDPFAEIKKYEEIVAACNRCGFCTSYCPTYNATGNEAYSPRGRNQMFRALIEKKVTDPHVAMDSINTCLLCGECTSVCFSEVPTAELMVRARHFLNQTAGVPPFLAFFLRAVLPHPRRLAWILKASFLMKRLGVPRFLRNAGLLQKLSPALAAADALMPQVPVKFLLDYPQVKAFHESDWAKLRNAKTLSQPKTEAQSAPQHRPKVALLPVCGSQYVLPEIGLAVVALLKRLKLDFMIPDSICCGLPAASYGVTERVRSMAQETIRRMERGHFEVLLTDDSSCASHFKDYPRYFQDDARWLKRAHDLSQKVKDLSLFLIQRGLKDHLKLAGWTGGPVAYHDPCKAQYGEKIINPPRELLASIPRLEIVPIADSDQCCGGGGTYSFVHPELSQAVLSAKVKNIIASGCKIVATSSASCLIQLRAGLREQKSNIQAMHLAEFLVRALEKRK